MEVFVLTTFTVVIIFCVWSGYPIILALIIGYMLFSIYALILKYKLSETIKMSLRGILIIKSIIILLALIGMLTALWRSAGTLPLLICYAMDVINPSFMILATFLLNSLVSTITGTSLGTTATMGVVCMTIANTMHLSPVVTGGAIISGIYFGDRCSPLSSSAILVAELTQTDIYRNVRLMLRTSIVPFALTCFAYIVLGYFLPYATVTLPDLREIFAVRFNLNQISLLPALFIVILSIFKVDVMLNLFVNVLLTFVISMTEQHFAFSSVLQIMILGYHAPDYKIAELLNGGGLISMLNVMAIVCLASCYAGIFSTTGLLDPIKKIIFKFTSATSPFSGVMITAIGISMVTCNQVLSIILTHQIYDSLNFNREELAIYLENSVVLIAPLVPWSIAAAAPLSIIAVPSTCLYAACYLYILPLWQIILEIPLILKHPN